MNEAKLTVREIDRQGDRTLLYGPPTENDRCLGRYHVIAADDVEISEGDVVVYEPYGFNFGWFVRKEANTEDAAARGRVTE